MYSDLSRQPHWVPKLRAFLKIQRKVLSHFHIAPGLYIRVSFRCFCQTVLITWFGDFSFSSWTGLKEVFPVAHSSNSWNMHCLLKLMNSITRATVMFIRKRKKKWLSDFFFLFPFSKIQAPIERHFCMGGWYLKQDHSKHSASILYEKRSMSHYTEVFSSHSSVQWEYDREARHYPLPWLPRALWEQPELCVENQRHRRSRDSGKWRK